MINVKKPEDSKQDVITSNQVIPSYSSGSNKISLSFFIVIPWQHFDEITLNVELSLYQSFLIFQ